MLDDIDATEEYVAQFVTERQDLDIPIFIQRFADYQHEYRVFIIDGEILGIVEKFQPDDSKIVANAAQGATFKPVVNAAVGMTALNYVRKKGIYGVDVAVDAQGEIHIIESNRTPQFEEFQNATGINVAEKIVASAYRAVTQPKEIEEIEG